MPDWLFTLILLVPGFFVQTLWHEGSHAVLAMKSGAKITSFKFWPHIADNDRFYFGRVQWEMKKPNFMTNAERAMTSWAPFIVGVPLWLLLCVVLKWVLFEPVIAAWLICVTIDVAKGMLQPWWRRDRGDANRGATMLQLDKRILKALGTVVSAGLITGSVWCLLPLVT